MNTIRHFPTSTVLRLSLVLAGLLSTWSHAATEPAPPDQAAQPGKAARPARAAKLGKADAAPPAPQAGRVELAAQVQLAEGKSTLMRLPFPATLLSVGDATVADVRLIKPDEVYMLGKSAGTTNLIVRNKQGDTTIVDLSVSVDTSALQARYGQLLQGEKDLHITAAADTLILSGTVSDVVKADQAMALANAYVQRSARSGASAGTGGASGASASASGGVSGGNAPKVVNLLKIAAPQQVMLEVKVAEVSKTLVDQLGASLGVSRTVGSWSYTLLSNLFSNNPSKVDAFNNRNGNFASLDAQKRDGLIKVLAEPTIMAISGQEASFLAGGKIFIPVAQNNNGGTQTITLEEKEFGVAVKFTPTVLDGGRINLKVAPEVSDLNKEGVGVTATGVSTTAILPSFTTRRATTTVQLFDGQSFAIGGLIKNNVTTSIKAFPGLGEIPVLGALFRSSDFQTDRTELVFIITPRLVQPLPADYKLPTDGYIQPSRGEFFLQGKLEGQPPAQSGPAPQQTAPTSGGFDVK